MRRLSWLLCLLTCAGCGAVSRGSRLSDRPPRADSRALYLSTGGSPRPFRTLGFAQITGHGVTVAGYSDVGNAAIDDVIQRSLVDVARQMGGDGVIHIDFEDDNPPTDLERASDLSQSFSGALRGQGVTSRSRDVIVTGEIIQFLPSP